MENEKEELFTARRARGRPKGAVKMTMERYAANPPTLLPKTDHARLKELKEILIKSGGKHVVEKVIQIALNDNHPGQMAALKMCIDRTLPTSMFEKDKNQRSAVTINITGIGDSNATQIIESELSISTKQIEQDKEQDNNNDDEDNITDLAPK
jgi:hypothetical protein